jgi:type I restriction enzyme S subunit
MKSASSALSAPPREEKVVWQTKTIGDLCDVVNGGTPKTGVPEYWDGSNLWITPAEMGKRLSPYVSDTERKITDFGLRNSSARMLPPNSVILSSRAPIGHLVINTEPMATNQGCKGLIPGSQLQHKFLYYYLSSIVDLLNSLGSGTTFKELSGTKLKEVTIPLPPLIEQQRIVCILDKAFAGLATAKANAEKSLQNAWALFESHLQSVFSQRGNGWVETTISDVCTLKSGTTVPVALERPSGDIPYVKVAEMTMPANRDGITTSIRFFNQSDIKPSWVIPAGAVIFPKRGGAILTNKKRLALIDVCADLNIMSVIPSDKLTPDFLYLYFLTIDMRELGTGSSIPQINNYDIAPLPIAFPHLKAQQIAITETLRSIEKECQTLAAIYERKLAALEALRKSLLHQAFTGNL